MFPFPAILAALPKAASIPAWVKGIGSAALAGATSGLGRRIEAQVAGGKARYDNAGGGALQIQREYLGGLGTMQGISQGQQVAQQDKYLDWQSGQNYANDMLQLELQRREHAQQRWLSTNGQMDAGEPSNGLQNFLEGLHPYRWTMNPWTGVPLPGGRQ